MKLKNMKKLLYSLMLFLLVVTFSFGSFAATTTGTTTLELVDESVCNIDVDNMASFEKKITGFSSNERSATLTLTLKNIMESETTKKPVEIFLVIDNSSSMTQNSINGVTRKQLVIDSANTLVEKLFEANESVKVGVVSFSSLDSVKGETEGTIDDAKLVLSLNNSETEVKSAIDSISTSTTGPRTNIEAGLTIAGQNYSSTENTKRYIILLTDGVPNNALDGSFATYIGDVGTRTKTKLQELENSGIEIIGAMIGLDGERVETQSGKTYKALAEEVFGTVDNPTISSYYYIQDSEIETTIVENVYNDIITVVDNSLKNITVKDYFPQEIIDNFNFEYVASPNIGNVSQEVDKTDNSITWNIELLKEGEIATLSYKLTLKDDYNKEIIDKILPTNTKVDITATHNESQVEDSSDVSPKVKVLYSEEKPIVQPVNIIPKDNTVAPTVIPQTGDNSIAFIVIISLVSITAIARFIYLKKNKEI